MKLNEIRGAYEDLSGTFSKISRTLALSGIAISWFFMQNFQGHNWIVIFDILAIIAFVITLLFDLSQYFILSLKWYNYYCMMKEKYHKEEDEEVKEKEDINDIGWLLYKCKFCALVIGYSLLAVCFIFFVLMKFNNR